MLFRSISPEALDIVSKQEWRGNVRELRNVVERALALAPGPIIQPVDLFMPGASGSIVADTSSGSGPGGTKLVNKSLEEVEKEAILQTLTANGGNRKKTARILGIAPVTLREKIRKYGIDQLLASADGDSDD